MRIFVCEYITGGGLIREDLPSTLVGEGDLMLAALVKDLADIGSAGLSPYSPCEVTICRDPRLPLPDLPCRFLVPDPAEDIWSFWGRCVDESQALWPIAPETDGALERLSSLAVRRDRILLGSPPQTVHGTASKFETARLLAGRGVPVIPTYRPEDEIPYPPRGLVVKPDDGAGAVDTRLFHDRTLMRRWIEAQDAARNFVIQPFAAGEAASLSALFCAGKTRVLSCNRQRVAFDGGHIRYLGFDVGGCEELRPPLTRLAESVAAAFPGLWGYAGIDVICGDQGPAVLEVNPRLTTSYVGLRESLGRNPAEMVLALLHAGTLPEPTARPRAAVTVEVSHA